MSEPRRRYPRGTDTVEVGIEGENIVARCYVCPTLEVIGTWPKSVSLNVILNALLRHQEQIAASTRTSKEI